MSKSCLALSCTVTDTVDGTAGVGVGAGALPPLGDEQRHSDDDGGA